MNPKISIITITYNSERTLEQTIKSVIEQNYNNLEYIIIDGGSKDKTLDIIKKYEDKIAYWVSERDHGISDAFNKGIRAATGEIIGIINSDDQLCDGALSYLAAHYKQETGVYRGNIMLVNPETGNSYKEVPSMKFSLTPILTRVSHQGTFVRKDVYLKYGMYDEKCRYIMDLDMLIRYYNAGVHFQYLEYIMANYTLGGITFGKMNKARYKEFAYVIKKNGGNSLQAAFVICVKKIRERMGHIIPKDFVLAIRHGRNGER